MSDPFDELRKQKQAAIMSRKGCRGQSVRVGAWYGLKSTHHDIHYTLPVSMFKRLVCDALS